MKEGVACGGREATRMMHRTLSKDGGERVGMGGVIEK